VKRIVFEASYLVLGLGDVYLGAPVATPVDPRHRLVTTKYNPARTWTPENAVGIGGAYLCVYGMEGPGGYQFVGRTCQMWNTYRTYRRSSSRQPWLLRFFDQIRFYPGQRRGTAANSATISCMAAPISTSGQPVKAGDPVVVVESMKMEMQVTAPADGIVVELRCAEGRGVTTGQTLAIFRPHADEPA
jgi:hypothetical protein